MKTIPGLLCTLAMAGACNGSTNEGARPDGGACEAGMSHCDTAVAGGSFGASNAGGDAGPTCTPTTNAGTANTSGNLFIKEFSTSPSACLAGTLPVDARCHVSCSILGASANSECRCTEPGQIAAASNWVSAVRSRLARSGVCDATGSPACSSYCICEIEQAVGSNLLGCRNDAAPAAGSTGWCYLSADSNPSSFEPPSACSSYIRLVGDLPQDTTLYLACN
jgi:hypothetical protein